MKNISMSSYLNILKKTCVCPEGRSVNYIDWKRKKGTEENRAWPFQGLSGEKATAKYELDLSGTYVLSPCSSKQLSDQHLVSERVFLAGEAGSQRRSMDT